MCLRSKLAALAVAFLYTHRKATTASHFLDLRKRHFARSLFNMILAQPQSSEGKGLVIIDRQFT